MPVPDEDLERYAAAATTLLLGAARAVTLGDTELRRDLSRRLVDEVPAWVAITCAAHAIADLAVLICAPSGADPAELLVTVAAVKQGLRLPPSSEETRPCPPIDTLPCTTTRPRPRRAMAVARPRATGDHARRVTLRQHIDSINESIINSIIKTTDDVDSPHVVTTEPLGHQGQGGARPARLTWANMTPV